MDSKKPFISIIIVGYNSIIYLDDCLSSVLSQTYSNYEIIFVDNGSTDGSSDHINKFYPSVNILKNANTGYAGGNNKGIQASRGDYIILLNPDTYVEKNWLQQLVNQNLSDASVAVYAPKILLYDRRGVVNSVGITANFTGISWPSGYLEHDSLEIGAREIAFASGCSFLVKRSVLEEVGYFDEDFFLYYEDVDLSWRIRLAGYKIILVPTSVVFHKYFPSKNKKKIYLVERNRLVSLLKNFELRTLILFFPALAITEISTLVYCGFNGNLFGKLRGYSYILTKIPGILQKRSIVQKIRKISDRDLLINFFTDEIDYVDTKKLFSTHMLNLFLRSYWRFMKLLL